MPDNKGMFAGIEEFHRLQRLEVAQWLDLRIADPPSYREGEDRDSIWEAKMRKRHDGWRYAQR